MGDETITESEIWADIDAVFPSLPEREPGDIDYHMIMDKYGVNETVARKRMRKLQEHGYELLEVRDDASHNGRIMVIRRVR